MFSETYPELWLFLMGGLFIAVVMFFPDGLAGVYEKYAKKFNLAGMASKWVAKFGKKATDVIGGEA
jgi:urea transport system permease protein